jgi:hypothetical protein
VIKRYQMGHLRRAGRKSGPHVWEFLWRETDETGKRVHRTAIVGTVEQYPTENFAWTAANGLRVYTDAGNVNRLHDEETNPGLRRKPSKVLIGSALGKLADRFSARRNVLLAIIVTSIAFVAGLD